MDKESEQFPKPPRRWVLTRVALLAGGSALLLLASAFLLVDPWERSSPRGVAASVESVGDGLQPQPLAAPEDPLAVAERFTRVEAGELYGGLFRLAVTLLPTPTPPPEAATPTAQPLQEPSAPPNAAAPPGSAPAASAPQPTATAAPPPPPGCPTAGMSGFAAALFDAINAERVQYGMASLAVDGCAVYVAQLRSNDMAAQSYFSHTGPNGSTAFSLLDAYAVPHGWAGENLARNNYPDADTVAVAIRDLMASQGHRDNILSGNYTRLGVGFAADSGGMKYFTMVFIGPP